MSVEEDVELKDLLIQTLMNNGSLAKIKAELRASIFLAFDKDEVVQKKQPYFNKKLSNYLDAPEGKLMFCIVREFLDFFNLDYTISVFEPESYLDINDFYEGRSKLAEALNLDVNESAPLLLQLIKMVVGIKPNLNIKLPEINIDDVNNDDIALENGTESKKTPKLKNRFLNETFEVTTPTIGINGEQVETPRSEESIKDDTYEGTSSIAEDSVKEKCLIDFDKSLKETNSDAKIESTKSLIDSSINEISSSIKFEKNKNAHQKGEKLKTKTNLSSLSDLPPLQLNKSRCNELLPSLYNRDMDTFFENDSMDNYEEDFMTGSELELISNPSDIREINRGSNKSQIKLDSPLSEKNNKSVTSSVTSDDFELDSNMDDILRSNSTN